MMEFAMSRWALFLCGAILVGTAAVPLSDALQEDAESDASGCAEGTASLLDGFWDSGLDGLYLRGSEVLPGPGWTMRISGGGITVTGPGGGMSFAGLAHPFLEELELEYGSEAEVFRDGGCFGTRRRCRRPCGGRPRSGLCPPCCCTGRPTRARCPRCPWKRRTGGRSASRSGP